MNRGGSGEGREERRAERRETFTPVPLSPRREGEERGHAARWPPPLGGGAAAPALLGVGAAASGGDQVGQLARRERELEEAMLGGEGI